MAPTPTGEPSRRELLAGLTAAGGLLLGGRGAAQEQPQRAAYRIVPRAVRDRLGEGVIWSARRNAIFWVDILRPTIWSMDLATRAIRHWPVPELICWIIERQGRDDFIVGLKRGFAILSLDPFAITTIGNPEPDMPSNRMNDAKVDRWGRIWAGTMGDGGGGPGSLYRLDPDRSWSRHDTGYRVTNGPTFSRDGTVLYHSDTPRRTVYAFDLGADGVLRNKRVFLRLSGDAGVPDGMTTDAEDGVWICQWDGGRVCRYRPDGTLDRTILLPASRVTDCTFTGAGLDRMFVTSATTGKDGEAEAGALFELDPGIKGLAPTLFAG